LDVERLLLPDLSARLMRDLFQPRLQAMYRHGIDVEATHLRERGVAVKQLSARLDQPYREAGDYARQRAGALVTHVTDTQRESVARLIARAQRQGLDPDTVAHRLLRTIGLRPDQEEAASRFRDRLVRSGVGGEDADRRTERYHRALQRQRARLIARSELIQSANAGQQAIWNEATRSGALPRGMLKRWIVTEDELLCPRCEALGDQEPVPVTAEFAPGVPYPGLHPNCRCAMALVSPGLEALMPFQPASWGPAAFDGRARRAAQQADGLWSQLRRSLSGDQYLPLPGSTGPEEEAQRRTNDEIVEKGIRLIADAVRQPGDPKVSDADLLLFQQGIPARGRWNPPRPWAKNGLMELDWVTSDQLATIFTNPDPLGFVRQEPRAYEALSTLVHELYHSFSLKDAYRTSEDQFIEEGSVEMRARRAVAALIYHGTSARERTLGRELMQMAHPSYQPFVTQMRWYEQMFGPEAVRAFAGRSNQQRYTSAADHFASWIRDYVRAVHPAIAPAFEGAMEGVNDVAWVSAWRAGDLQRFQRVVAAGSPVGDAELLDTLGAMLGRTVRQLANRSPLVPLQAPSPFDALARKMARESSAFWKRVMDFVPTDYDPDLPPGEQGRRLLERYRHETVENFVNEIAKLVSPDAGFRVSVFEVGKPYAGAWDGETIHVAFNQSAEIWNLLTQGGSARRSWDTLNGVKTAVHEVLHALNESPLFFNPKIPGENWDQATVFVEEGTVEKRARLLASSLVFHGLKPEARRAARARFAARTQSYEPYVKELSWYERHVGNLTNVYAAGQGYEELGSRESYMTGAIGKWVIATAVRYYPEIVSAVSSLFVGASPLNVVNGLMYGKWRYLDSARPRVNANRFYQVASQIVNGH
jgi:hypothetical protein